MSNTKGAGRSEKVKNIVQNMPGAVESAKVASGGAFGGKPLPTQKHSPARRSCGMTSSSSNWKRSIRPGYWGTFATVSATGSVPAEVGEPKNWVKAPLDELIVNPLMLLSVVSLLVA